MRQFLHSFETEYCVKKSKNFVYMEISMYKYVIHIFKIEENGKKRCYMDITATIYLFFWMLGNYCPIYLKFQLKYHNSCKKNKTFTLFLCLLNHHDRKSWKIFAYHALCCESKSHPWLKYSTPQVRFSYPTWWILIFLVLQGKSIFVNLTPQDGIIYSDKLTKLKFEIFTQFQLFNLIIHNEYKLFHVYFIKMLNFPFEHLKS